MGVKDPAPAKMLVGYPNGHTTLGGYGTGTTIYYNGATAVRGLVFPYNTSSVLFFGTYGYGPEGDGTMCYGIGTDDHSLHKKPVPGHEGVKYCYDPCRSAKGPHAYPYAMRVWAYAANDLLKVKNREINPSTGNPYQPWDLKPYEIWDLESPLNDNCGGIDAVAYDPQTQRIFISQRGKDRERYERYPLIYVFQINVPSRIGGSPDTTPPSTPKNLTASAVSSFQINLSWDSSTDNVGVAGYKIYRDGTQIATSQTISYQDTNLVPETTYSYAVAAYDAAGNTSSQSVSINAATLILGDLNNDGIVNSVDWSIMSSYWFTANTQSYLNKDGIVNSIDFSLMNQNWGKGK